MEKAVAFAKGVYQRIMNDDIIGLAAQLAYFFLLSLFPFLLFLLTLVGYLPIEESRVIAAITDYAPAQITDLINANISQLINQQNGGLLSIGIIGTLWAASNAINALTKALNKAYEVEEDRLFIVSRLIAIVLTIAMVLIICIAFLLPIFGQMIGESIFSLFGLSEGFLTVWEAMRWLVSSLVFFIVFLTLYKLAPNIKVYFKNVIWGALFSTISWQLVSLGFSFYVNNMGNYSATYGSLGAVIVLMIWLYISGIIIMTGGVINAVVRKHA
ncbi:YihY/virulence factor BrkB family protein [Virgibacillus sp. NKC19-3]|uniref:YihY/virulence factor BrkB family protein n=1 Tax=Virgibacillus saliphilus TaxID=2831674 RepID=UPI001C9AC9D7|nr:YihY/virulence factor BrkB family protein [Virgibacillus sp. NKC19-3]MBY7142728.1 YihY/virulence factor BrkB family protein [Virgibacillus sp. NKC19-3]